MAEKKQKNEEQQDGLTNPEAKGHIPDDGSSMTGEYGIEDAKKLPADSGLEPEPEFPYPQRPAGSAEYPPDPVKDEKETKAEHSDSKKADKADQKDDEKAAAAAAPKSASASKAKGSTTK